MSYPLSGLVRKQLASRTIVFRCAALVTLVLLLLLFNACSGMSVPATSSTGASTTTSTSTSSSTSNSSLTISATLPPAFVGSTYSANLTATGGTAPYVFSIASGELPPGVSLGASTGDISGTPTATGNFNLAISVSDSEATATSPITITVAANGETSFSNLQQSGGWSGYGQGPPDFVDCSPSPCDGISYSMTQGVTSPSMSGEATQLNVGGTAVYSDALFNNHLIGDLSSQGMPDKNHALVPTYHNFTYDVYFYGTNLELSQAVEFDINQFFGNLGFIWGHECRIAGGNEWDVWDNVTAHWVPTGVACNPISNSWNHLTIQVQRTSDNQLLYQSITLNGVTNTLNQTYDPGAAPGWNGVTINYQMDGNSAQSAYSVYLDELTFTYD